MLDPAQARAYAAADFAEPHDRFVALLRARLPELPPRGTALDLGCGSGDVSLRFLRDFPHWSLDAVDGSPAMLALAREAAARAGVAARVLFAEVVLPAGAAPEPAYDLVFSNSLLHHLGRPAVLWEGVRRHAHRATCVFVMDLLRPASRDDAAALVDRYAAGEADVLRRDFFNSLLAAFRIDEIRAQLAAAGLAHLRVEQASDRHVAVWGRVSP